MIYGIEAAAETMVLAGSPGQSWSASNAVTFNSARLVLPSVTCTDNAYFSFAGWFNSDWDAGGNYGGIGFMVDPEGDWSSSIIGKSDNSLTFNAADGTHYTGGIVAAPPIVSNSWQHIMGTVQTSPSRIVKVRVNDVDVTGGSLSIFGPTFTPIPTNGKPLWVGSDSIGGDFYVGDMKDLSIWPGISFLTAGDISEATRRLFIDAGGKPVDPATAIASLGSPAVMLSGGAASFASNALGTSGAFTIAEGTLTNAATSP